MIETRYQAVVTFDRKLSSSDDKDDLRNHLEAIYVGTWTVEDVDLADTHVIVTVRETELGNTPTQVKEQVVKEIRKYSRNIQKRYADAAPTEVVNTGGLSSPSNALYRESRQKQKTGELEKGEWIIEKEHPDNLGPLGTTGTYVRSLAAGQTPEEWVNETTDLNDSALDVLL